MSGIQEHGAFSMPKFDQRCTACDWTGEVIAKPFEHPPCESCGSRTERYYPIGGQRYVISDEIIGGRWVENIAPTPIWVESKSHLRRELASRGLEERVRHVGSQDGDRSAHTTRWY